MNKNTRKTMLSVLAAVVIFAALYLGVKTLNKPKVVVGEKAINIVVLDKDSEKAFDETFNTDAELLGELLDEINADKDDMFEMTGSKDDEFGRYITGISVVDIETGEFWVYDSDNNKVCEAEGFCSGIDMLAIEDGNNFSFNVLLP